MLNQDDIVQLADLIKQAAAIAVKLKVLWRSSAFQEDEEDIDKMINEPIGNAGDSFLIEHLFEEAASLYKGLQSLEKRAALNQRISIVVTSDK